MIRLLLDENISPALVRLLADLGVYSQSPHVGLAGRADHLVWQYALDHDFAVVRPTRETSSHSSTRLFIRDNLALNGNIDRRQEE
jgi:predicted nuclease of predicted toxin-antitoxin system